MTAAQQLELTEPTVKKSGKKWRVLCPSCGEVGANTTEAYAEEAAGAHVAEAHPDWAVQSIDRPAAVLTFAEIPVDQIVPSPVNPRGDDMGDLEGLKASIAADGIIQPLAVEQCDGDHTGNGGCYRIVAGQRRWTAAKELGLAAVPCVVRQAVDDDHRLELMLIENLQREDVNPMGEARAFRALEQLGLSQRTIAARVGCSQSHISKRLTLLELPPAVQKRVGAGDASGISVAAALELTKLKNDPKAIAEIAKGKKIEADDVVRKVEAAQREAERKAKVDAIKASAKQHGWKIVKYDGYYLPKSVKPLSVRQYDGGLEVDVAAHRKEPCHGVVAETYNGHPGGQHVCVDPARHKAKGDSALKVFTPVKPQKTEWELNELEHQRGRKAASASRLEVLPKLIATKAPAGRAALAILASEVIDVLGWETKKTACALLGLPAGDGDASKRLWAAAEKDLVRVAVACVMARGHERAHSLGQHSSIDGYRELAHLYDFMLGAGYEPTEWEREQLAKRDATKDQAAPLRARLVAMCSRIAPNEPEWMHVAGTVADEEVIGFLEDSGDPPIDELDDSDIQRQQFAAYFEDDLVAAGWAEAQPLFDDDVACRVCGCTQERACEGGCSWAEVDLCSACVDEPALAGAPV